MNAFFDGLNTVFAGLLQCSWNASWGIAAVLAVHLLGRRAAPRRALCALWAVVGFRLLCPASFSARFSLLPAARPLTAETAAAPTLNNGLAAVSAAVAPLLPAAAPGDSADPQQIVLGLAALVWLIGVLLGLAYGLCSAGLLRRRLRFAVLLPWPENAAAPTGHRAPALLQCDGLETAFVMGLLRPRIYLPAGLSAEQTRYILCHECMHLRRRDHLVKPLAYALLCLHWFNPLVWLAFAMLGRDMEMACDEAVVHTLGGSVRKAYSSALLALATGRFAAPGSPLAFGEGSVRGRIQNVLRGRRAPKWAVAVSGLALIALAVCLLADPISKPTPAGASTSAPGTPADSAAGQDGQTPDAAGESLPLPQPTADAEQTGFAAGADGFVSVTFPAYQDGRSEYNAVIYDAAPFTARLRLPEGWTLALPETRGPSLPWTPVNICNTDGDVVGSIGFGLFEDVPELPTEEFYKAALAELRLSSQAVWCANYTPVRTSAQQETATGLYEVSDALLHPESYEGNTAAAPMTAYPSVTVWDRTLLAYAALQLAPGAVSDAQLTAIAESLTLQPVGG